MGVNEPAVGSRATSGRENEGGNDIYESHGQLPFTGQQPPYMDIDFSQNGKVTPIPPLMISENLSEIGGLSSNMRQQ